MNEKDPKNLVELVEIEQEQNWEEILRVLEDAIENKSEVELTVLNPYGGSSRTAMVIPWSIEKGVLGLTTQGGLGMAVDLSRIKRAVKLG